MAPYTFSGRGRVKVFKRVGRCIYCGTSEHELSPEQESLTDEHIIPLGLGGNMILPAASCKACQVIINRDVEQPLQRGISGMFTPARANIGLHGRKRDKNGRTVPELSIIVENQFGFRRTIHAKGTDVPFALAGFISGPPEYFAIRPTRRIETWFSVDHAHLMRLGVRAGEKVHGLGYFDSLLHSRLVAKIGLALTYAVFPYDRVKPWVRDLILGRDELSFRFVGSQPSSNRTNNLHRLSVSQLPFMPPPLPPGSDKIIAASITLFHSYGAPEYLILVGELDGSFDDRFPIT
jgi:hypothetical protein